MKDNLVTLGLAYYLLEETGVEMFLLHEILGKKWDKKKRRCLSSWIDSFYWVDYPFLGQKRAKDLCIRIGNHFNDKVGYIAQTISPKINPFDEAKRLPRGLPFETFYY